MRYRYQAKRTADEPIAQELQPIGRQAASLGLWQDDRLFEKPGTWLEPQTDPQSVPSDGTASEEKTKETVTGSHCPGTGGAWTVRTRPGRWIS